MMQLDWTVQQMPRAGDWIVPGDFERTQDAPGTGASRGKKETQPLPELDHPGTGAE